MSPGIAGCRVNSLLSLGPLIPSVYVTVSGILSYLFKKKKYICYIVIIYLIDMYWPVHKDVRFVFLLLQRDLIKLLYVHCTILY